MNLENKGERMDINYYNIDYNNFDIYQKSHYKRYEFVKKMIKEDDIVGDMACGSGYGSMMLSENAKKVYGYDIDETTINEISNRYENKKNVNFRVNNLLNIKKDNYFDKIVSFETVEHFDSTDIGELMKIFHSSLKEDGHLIFSTPYDQEDSAVSRVFHKKFHIIEDTIHKMVEKLFIVEELYYQNYEHHDLVKKLDNEKFIICVARKI
jgi:2-polyprenyl-3-methyl-5-hydroxy-6-metoxy-1,4-benzoquinol methylase